MKLEELTKQQIVLLALLVAFVSSTASAIVVVRLMEQAPVTSSPTINRVIERTVQQIIPGETREITKVNTVVIKEEDLVVEAIDANRKSVVLVRESIVDELGTESRIINGTGLYLEDGYVIADGRLISGPGNYYMVDGEVRIPLSFVEKDQSGISVLKVDESISLEEISFSPKNIDINPNTKVGQSGIVISSNSELAAFTGLISSFSPFTTIAEGEEKTLFSRININISLLSRHSGGVLVNSDGDVSGLVMVRDNDIFAIPVGYIRQVMNRLSELASVDKDTLQASAINSVPAVE